MKHTFRTLIALTISPFIITRASFERPSSPRIDPQIIAFFDIACKTAMITDFFKNASVEHLKKSVEASGNSAEDLEIFFQKAYLTESIKRKD